MSFDPEGPSDPNAGIFGVAQDASTAKIILIPVPFDATTSYRRGASRGPKAILDASDQLDLFDHTLNDSPYTHGICLLPENNTVRQWNVSACTLADEVRNPTLSTTRQQSALAQVNEISEQLNQWLYQETKTYLAQGRIVGVIGGDHATPFGSIQAHLERYPTMGVLHIDAHADLRNAYEGFTWSHASIMYNVITKTTLETLVQVGIRDFSRGEYDTIQQHQGRITTFFDQDLADAQLGGIPFQEMANRIIATLPQDVYVSFDIDGLDPQFCPHTGTPVPGGLSYREALALIATITTSGRRIVGFDLNEVAPGADGDEWDGNVGARLVYKLCGHALRCSQ